MYQPLVSPKPRNIAPLPRARSGRSIHLTDSAGIQALRHEATSLRAATQAKMTLACTSAMPRDPADLLQRTAILDRAADVLALTNWT